MNSGPVIVIVLIAIGFASVGFLRAAMASSPPTRLRMRSQQRLQGGVAVMATVGLLWAPDFAVFWVLLALNALLGGQENVPFSWFPMFSNPPEKTSALSFEDSAGNPVPVAKFGFMPTMLKKRFATELAARRDIADLATARVEAAKPIIALIQQRRPVSGEWASGPISVVLVEYRIEKGSIAEQRQLLGEVTGR